MPDDKDEEVVRIAELFADVARDLASPEDVDAVLERIVHLAVKTLHNCEDAGISWVEGRKITSPAATGPRPMCVDQIQSEVGEGPCLDAIREHEVFSTGDLRGEARWPNFAVRAHAETGITSVLAFRLFVEGNTLGALNLYSTERDAFDDEVEVALGAVFAAHAAVAIASSRREEDLERKAASRDLIGRAKGVLMARSNITDDVAFDMLRRASQRLNVKLTQVATDVVDRASEPAARCREGGD